MVTVWVIVTKDKFDRVVRWYIYLSMTYISIILRYQFTYDWLRNACHEIGILRLKIHLSIHIVYYLCWISLGSVHIYFDDELAVVCDYHYDDASHTDSHIYGAKGKGNDHFM